MNKEQREAEILKRIEQDERIEIGVELGEARLLAILVNQSRMQTLLLRGILGFLTPKLRSIQLVFGGTMSQTVTLSQGQSTVASVLYFDQTGARMPDSFVPPSVSFSIDNAGIASSTPNPDNQTDTVAWVSAGVANLTASVTSAEGLALSDAEAVTCSPVVTPPPVLSSIKIDFSTPTP